MALCWITRVDFSTQTLVGNESAWKAWFWFIAQTLLSMVHSNKLHQEMLKNSLCANQSMHNVVFRTLTLAKKSHYGFNLLDGISNISDQP